MSYPLSAVTICNLLGVRVIARQSALIAKILNVASSALLVARLGAGTPLAPLAHLAVDARISIGACLSVALCRLGKDGWPGSVVARFPFVHIQLEHIAVPILLAPATGLAALVPRAPLRQLAIFVRMKGFATIRVRLAV
jgi:hypothetical protein